MGKKMIRRMAIVPIGIILIAIVTAFSGRTRVIDRYGLTPEETARVMENCDAYLSRSAFSEEMKRRYRRGGCIIERLGEDDVSAVIIDLDGNYDTIETYPLDGDAILLRFSNSASDLSPLRIVASPADLYCVGYIPAL